MVGRGVRVQGTLQEAERLWVEGYMEASTIRATELSIAHGGLFKGEVEMEDAEIFGTLEGTLMTSGILVVRDTGRVLGRRTATACKSMTEVRSPLTSG